MNGKGLNIYFKSNRGVVFLFGVSLVVVLSWRMKEGTGRFSSYERQVPICISSATGFFVLMLIGFDFEVSISSNKSNIYTYFDLIQIKFNIFA